MRITLFCLLVLTLFLASCVTQRDVEYIQSDISTAQAFDEAQVGNYRLKPEDELYIQISSLDDPTASIFSSTGAQQLMNISTIQPYGASLLSYTIDKDGYLILPVIGRISVQDKTVTEVSDLITASLSKILSQPMVTVKLVSRYVTVLGEVRTPGHFAYTHDKLSVYEALGLAGDITDYGNRKEVILTRNVDGQNLRIPIDLTQSELLESEYYYIQPKDMLYVKPMRKRFWALREFPYTVVLSSITAGILLYGVIR